VLQILWAVVGATIGHGTGALLLAIVNGASALLIVALLVSMWGDMREDRAEEDDLMRSIDLLDRDDARTILRKRQGATADGARQHHIRRERAAGGRSTSIAVA
jgi:hypothetical protein